MAVRVFKVVIEKLKVLYPASTAATVGCRENSFRNEVFSDSIAHGSAIKS